MATKSYHEMTDAELEAENFRLQEAKAEIRAAQVKLQEVYSQRVAVAEARRRLEELSPDARAALAQIVQAEGIASAEAHGRIGSVEAK